jgi:hypothetical protein
VENPLKRRQSPESDSGIPEKNPCSLPITTQIKTSPAKSPIDEKPLQEISNKKDTPKTVQFSEKTETKFIDSNLEQFQQSVAARKKSQIIVKRIVIPSRVVKKEENLN